MPIPPSGWGAVEILIWDYYQELVKRGHEVQIVNTRNPHEIVDLVNKFNPDFVHLQYDEHYHVMDRINCRARAATSHYGYLEVPHHVLGSYNHIFKGFVNGNFDIFCLSEGIKKVYLDGGASESRLFVTPNGARSDLFEYFEEPEFNDLSIYLAKITDRKKQYLYQNIDFIHFAGNLDDERFNPNRNNYLGEWTKEHLYSNLSKYSNLILLSDGEAHPLVCCEALVSGLGLVISECAAGNLDRNLPFIEIIPNERLKDVEYVSNKIRENQSISRSMRSDIRNYGLQNFDWGKLIDDYIQKIQICIERE
jgi:hypothetical protein